jgi:hypothetical protein
MTNENLIKRIMEARYRLNQKMIQPDQNQKKKLLTFKEFVTLKSKPIE